MGKTSKWIKNICVHCAEHDRNKDTWVSTDKRIPLKDYMKNLRKNKLLEIEESENNNN